MRQIHITDANGRRLFNRLWDNGSLTLTFDSGFGFVDRLLVAERGWVILDGWPD